MIRADVDYQKTKLGSINYKGDYVSDKSIDKESVKKIDNRQTPATYKRFSLRIDSQPINLLGDHRFSLQTYMSKRHFENVNDDLDVDSNKHSIYTIQNPVNTKQYGISLLDNVTFNDTYSANLGIRYDHSTMVPLDYNVPYKAPTKSVPKKPETAKFNNLSGLIGLNAQINENWKLNYLVSSGYRLPSASEIFFTFESNYGNWAANPNLKAERSLSQSLTLQGKGEVGELDFTIHHTRYHNFLFEQETLKSFENPGYDEDFCYGYGINDACKYLLTPYQQMVNLDKAKISGLEFKGTLNLHSVVNSIPTGFSLFGAVGYSKGKLSNGESLLSIQPIKTILGFDYESPNKTWGIFSRFTYLGAKKNGDAKIGEIEVPSRTWVCKELGCEVDEEKAHRQLNTYRWLNGSAFITDLFGYYKPIENVTLRAGVYNLFNRKYHTWDSLRGINRRSTTNGLNWDTGYGLERFYQPGRNFAASVEIRF